jgi:hypothetical protein
MQTACTSALPCKPKHHCNYPWTEKVDPLREMGFRSLFMFYHSSIFMNRSICNEINKFIVMAKFYYTTDMLCMLEPTVIIIYIQ